MRVSPRHDAEQKQVLKAESRSFASAREYAKTVEESDNPQTGDESDLHGRIDETPTEDLQDELEAGNDAWTPGALPRNSAAAVAAWRRRAHRRAVRHGASTRNQYLLGAGTSSSSSSNAPSRVMMPSLALTPLPQEEPGDEAPQNGPEAFKVWLHVYDLRGTEGTNDTVISMGIGIFHTGVEIFGVEWSYGYVRESDPAAPPASGVYPVPPRRSPIGTYRESIFLGSIRAHSAQDAWWLVQSLGGAWLGNEYHPIRHNCHHFCAELCEKIGVSDLPGWIGRLAVAADYVLMPLLEALDAPVVPVPAAPAEEFGSGAGAEDGGNEERIKKLKEASPRKGLSVATSIALYFEEKFSWAFVRMMMFEEQGTHELHRSDLESEPAKREAMAGFL